MGGRTELIVFADDAEIRTANLLCMAFPGEALAELIEFGLVGKSRHIHEALLEGRRCFLKNRVVTRLETGGHGGAGAYPRLAGGGDGAENRAEAQPVDADAVRIDLRPCGEPIAQSRPG